MSLSLVEKKTYSQLKHIISELGESGSSHEKLISFGLFFSVGLVLIFVSFLNSSDEGLHGLALCIGAGYLVAAFFPCDEGSPLEGSWKQQIHNLGGFIEYAEVHILSINLHRMESSLLLALS